MGKLVVIDTNVPLVASRRSPQASADCVAVCAMRVAAVMGKGCVLLDEGGAILGEYTANFRSLGQPQVCDAFLKWVLSNRRNRRRCVEVDITPIAGRPGDYAEFPRAVALAEFDLSDRKFVAAARAHGGGPPILQAVDAGWWSARMDLAAQGVSVEFLCEDDITGFKRAGA